jgi:hypothetical protein
MALPQGQQAPRVMASVPQGTSAPRDRPAARLSHALWAPTTRDPVMTMTASTSASRVPLAASAVPSPSRLMVAAAHVAWARTVPRAQLLRCCVHLGHTAMHSRPMGALHALPPARTRWRAARRSLPAPPAPPAVRMEATAPWHAPPPRGRRGWMQRGWREPTAAFVWCPLSLGTPGSKQMQVASPAPREPTCSARGR